MGYLSPFFDNDVFVSYSHGDPRGRGTSELKNWTLELLNRLEDHILAIDPEFSDLVIWRDDKLDPTRMLTPELKGQVGSSAILFIVMSPHYLNSRWCGDELAWFREQIRDRAIDPERVFVIRAVMTETEKWPQFLRDERGFASLGFAFHHPEKDTPYCWAGSREDLDDYLKCLGTLRTTLTRRLRALRGRAEARSATSMPTGLATGGARRIYLHARAEDSSVRRDIQESLTLEGLTPVSASIGAGTDLTDWTRESRIRIEAAKHCAALALVRTETDPNFVATLLDIGLSEREVIAAARGAPLPCAVLDRTGEDLPVDVRGWGIERFDLRSNSWLGSFLQWLDAVRAPAARATT